MNVNTYLNIRSHVIFSDMHQIVVRQSYASITFRKGCSSTFDTKEGLKCSSICMGRKDRCCIGLHALPCNLTPRV